MSKQSSISLFVFNSFPQLISCLSIYYYHLDQGEKSNTLFCTDLPLLADLINYHRLTDSLVTLHELCSLEVLSLYLPHQGLYLQTEKYLANSPKIIYFGDSLGLHYSSTSETSAWINLLISLFPFIKYNQERPFTPSGYFLSKSSISTQRGSPVTVIPPIHYRQTYSLFSALYEGCFIDHITKCKTKSIRGKPRLFVFAYSRSTSCIASYPIPRILLKFITNLRLLMGCDVLCCYHPKSLLGTNSGLKYPIEFYLYNLHKNYDSITIISTSTSGYASSLLLDYVEIRFSFLLCCLEIIYLPFRSKLKRFLRSLRLSLMLVSPFF